MSYKKRKTSYTTSYTTSYVKMARTCILTYDIVRQTYDIVYDIVYDIYMNKCCLVRIVTHHCPYRPCSTLSPQVSNDQDRAWNLDDERDYADQQSALHSPMTHYPGSRDTLARFLSTVQDWSVLDKMALDNAIGGLPVPVIGPAPFGISVHDAIKVKHHDGLLYGIVYDIIYDIVCMLYSIRYRIRYTVYDIVHDVVYDIVYYMVCISPHVWKAANQPDLVSGT